MVAISSDGEDGRTLGGLKLLWDPLGGNGKQQLLLQTQGPGKSDQMRLGVKGTGVEAPLSPVPQIQWSVPYLVLTSQHLTTQPAQPPPNTF